MSKARVLIDGYYLGRPSGYGRFVAELVRAVASTDAPFNFLVAVPRNVKDADLVTYERIRYIRLPRAAFPIWEQVLLVACARRNGCDLIHFPYNTRALFPGRVKTVTTVHDLTFLKTHTERDLKSVIIHLYMRAAFYGGTVRSDEIIAVSDTTRAALLEKNLPARRIYNSVDGFISTTPRGNPIAFNKPYLLHRGSYAVGHRNTERIIAAFLGRSELRDNFELKIFGVPNGAAHWHVGQDQPIHFLDRVSDQELAWLYLNSRGVVAASLLEGFCLPIVEAFGFGAPVLTSTVNPMKEIAGGAALSVAPEDTAALGDAMLRLLSEPELAKSLALAGKSRLSEFSSAKMAAQLLSVYNKVLNSKLTPL